MSLKAACLSVVTVATISASSLVVPTAVGAQAVPSVGIVAASNACINTSSKNAGNPVLDANQLNVPKVGCSGNGEAWLTNLLKIVFGLMSMLSLIFVALGAFKYTTSGGSGDAIASAKKTIIYALLGLLLGTSAFTIVSIVLGATS